MAMRYATLDVSSVSATFRVARSGTVEPLPEAVSSVKNNADAMACWTARRDGLTAELDARMKALGGNSANLLVSLPDDWFRIALLKQSIAPGRTRLDDYARWKIRSEWNLPLDDVLFDWLDLSSWRSGGGDLLLVAASRALMESVAEMGTVLGAPVSLIVPRGLACWNGWRPESGRRKSDALVINDAEAFTFLGSVGGRLTYFRCRRCETVAERDFEVAETTAHFSRNAGGAAVPAQSVDPIDPLLCHDGLLAHPIVSGFFR